MIPVPISDHRTVAKNVEYPAAWSYVISDTLPQRISSFDGL